MYKQGYNFRVVRLRKRSGVFWYEVDLNTFVRAQSRQMAEVRYVEDNFEIGITLEDLYKRFGDFDLMLDDGTVDEAGTAGALGSLIAEARVNELIAQRQEAPDHVREAAEVINEAVNQTVLSLLDEFEQFVDRETADYTSRVEGKTLLEFIAAQRGRLK